MNKHNEKDSAPQPSGSEPTAGELYRVVKASERLPDKKQINEWFNLRLKGFPAIGKFIKFIGHDDLGFDIEKYGNADSKTFKNLEWFEKLPPQPVVQHQQDELWEELVKYLNSYNSQNISGQMYFPLLDLKSKYLLIKKEK